MLRGVRRPKATPRWKKNFCITNILVDTTNYIKVHSIGITDLPGQKTYKPWNSVFFFNVDEDTIPRFLGFMTGKSIFC